MQEKRTEHVGLTGLFMVAFGGTVACSGASAASLETALKGGKVSGSIRLRYEHVDEEGDLRNAKAMTVRTRLGYETGTFKDFSLVGEFEDVRPMLGVDDYAPEQSGYAVIADPSDTGLNRAFLRYQGIPALELSYGRQRINYDNQRFIGAVGWRQNEQTFDGFTAAYTGIAKLVVNYAYITQVNGITDAFDSKRLRDNWLHISYSGFALGKLSTYAFLLDHSDEKDPQVNAGLRFHASDTIGLRVDGSWAVPESGGAKVLYAAEYAHQEFENTLRTDRYRASYHFLEAGISRTVRGVNLMAKIAREVLGSDGGSHGFQTPFATKHAFNGWADKFLVTPAAGLQDDFVTLSAALPSRGVNLMTVWHDYEADKGSEDFGSEWNLQATKSFGSAYTLGIKYSTYEGRDLPYRDTDKLWFWGEVAF